MKPQSTPSTPRTQSSQSSQSSPSFHALETEEQDPRTGRIIGAAIEVHRALGPGLTEPLYEKALCIEFDLRGIAYQRQYRVPATYKGRAIGGFRVDLVVEDAVIVEVKSVSAVLPLHEAQILCYMRLTKKNIGLLINFNSKLLKDGVHRFAL